MKLGSSLKERVELGKKAFDLYLSGGCKDEALVNLAQEHNISIKTLKIEYLNYYRSRIIMPKPSAGELKEYYNHLVTTQKALATEELDYSFIQTVLSMTYTKEAIDYISSCEYSISEIYQKIRSYINANPTNSAEIKKLMKIDEIIKHKRAATETTKKSGSGANVQDKAEIMKVIALIIEEFLITDDAALEDVIDRYKAQINYQTFSKYLDNLITGSEEQKFLFNRLVEKIEQDKTSFEALARKIVFNIKNGVLKDDKVSKFTVLDYHRITRIMPSRFLQIVKKLYRQRQISKSDYEQINSFFEAYDDAVVTKEQLASYSSIIDGKAVTPAEKEVVIDYLKSVPAPLTKDLFTLAYAEYVSGGLKTKVSLTE